MSVVFYKNHMSQSKNGHIMQRIKKGKGLIKNNEMDRVQEELS